MPKGMSELKFLVSGWLEKRVGEAGRAPGKGIEISYSEERGWSVLRGRVFKRLKLGILLWLSVLFEESLDVKLIFFIKDKL